MPFRFDAASHTYYDNGQAMPHITGMLEQCGFVDKRWYTEASRDRGTKVHELTAAYDLDAISLASVVASHSLYKPYLQAHVKALGVLQPEILEVEVPRIHPAHRFGGRPDRVVRYAGLAGVLEIKSGGVEAAHGIQTALQAILVAPWLHLPAEALVRLCLYLKPSGRFKVEEHTDTRDYAEARRVIAECCKG